MKTLKAAIIILTIAVLMASSVNAYAAYTHEYVGAQVKSYAWPLRAPEVAEAAAVFRNRSPQRVEVIE